MKHRTPKTLQELANALGATLQGDPQCVVTRLAPLEKAEKGDLSFLTQANYRKYLSNTKASAVILGIEDVESCKVSALIFENPRFALIKAAEYFEKLLGVDSRESSKIHKTAIIEENCQIPESVSIGPYAILGKNVVLGENVIIGARCTIGDDCNIGAGTELKAGVTLYHQITIGTNCLIHSGVIIGADGFGYVREDDLWYKMPHLGGVTLGNKVEVGANTTIDRGAIEDTELGDHVIIDNLVQIGHNVTIGDRTAIAACTAIAGSTHIGKDCLIGGAACISGHLDIGDKVYITATSGVNHSIQTPGVYSSGMPARPNHQWRKNIARFNHLDEIAKRLKVLEKHLNIKTTSEVE